MSLAPLAFYIFMTIALGGIVMTGFILAEKKIPAFLGPLHGLGGLVGLGTLLLANLRGPSEAPERAWWALAIFATGFIGGVVFFRVLYRESAPVVLVAGHAMLALIGLATLYPFAFAPTAPIPILSP